MVLATEMTPTMWVVGSIVWVIAIFVVTWFLGFGAQSR